jgi:hypothetical protein
MEQSRAELLNPRNRVSAYHEDDGGFLSFGKSGAGKLADATMKYNEAKLMLKNAANQVHARKEMLQYRLRRMDAAVQPEVGAPSNIAVFNDKRPKKESFIQVAEDVTKPVAFTQEVFSGKDKEV